MRSLSGLEIGLSFVSGLFLLGLVAEVHYFLWWKRRLKNAELVDESNNYAPLFSYLFCWRKPNFMANNPIRNQEVNSSGSRNRVRESNENEQDIETGTSTSTDALLKGLGGEENLDVELMRIHNLWGPPRFLFTIKEETKEDLEDAKSRGDRSRKGSRTRSLSDVFSAADTCFLTPLSSPTIKSLQLDAFNFNHRGFNPLFETFTDSDLSKLRSSPPPKFKFLRDAEEKLIKRLVQETERRKTISVQDSDFKSIVDSEEKQVSLISPVLQQEEDIIHTSNLSKVIPLVSSPSTIRPIKL